MTRVQLSAWLGEYERAWRTSGTAGLVALFGEGATYQLSPYDEPIAGLDAIAAMWERERAGPDEQFTMSSEIVAIDGDTAVVRVAVATGRGTRAPAAPSSVASGGLAVLTNRRDVKTARLGSASGETGSYAGPKTRSRSAVSPAVWNLISLPSRNVMTSAVSACSPSSVV